MCLCKTPVVHTLCGVLCSLALCFCTVLLSSYALLRPHISSRCFADDGFVCVAWVATIFCLAHPECPCQQYSSATR